MREVTYDAITKRIAALEAENEKLRNALREIAETGPPLRYDPSATHEQIDEVIYGKR